MHVAKSGHLFGSLPVTDIFTYRYFEEMCVNPTDVYRTDRGASPPKGYCASSLYAVLAERGFPQRRNQTPYRVNSHLQDHPNMNGTHWVDVSTDSWTRASPPYLVTVS